MAPKRPPPIEQSPAVSSSEEEVSEEEMESEEEQGLDPKKKNSSKKPEVSADEDSGSEDSESDDTPPTIVKPRSSKATASASVAMSPAKSTGKRPVENSEDGTVSKRVKKSAREDAKKKKGVEAACEDLAQVVKKSAREDAKKPMFKRIWSIDDEIVILNGIINYSTEKGKDISSDVNAFHDFIKKSIHRDFSKTQLMDKVRKLKKKYVNNAKRSKKGEDPTFSKPHEQKSYELSKKVWGTEATNNGVHVVEQKKSNRKAKKAQKSDKISTPIDKEKLPESPQIPEDPQPNHETKHTEEEITEIKNDSILLNQSIAAAGMDLYFMKAGLGLIDHGERSALEEEWRELQLTQTALYLRRINFVGELITLALETPKKCL